MFLFTLSFIQVAAAMLYARNRPPVVQIDLRPSSILLDQNLTAKVGNIGVASQASKSRQGALCVGAQEKRAQPLSAQLVM